LGKLAPAFCIYGCRKAGLPGGLED